MRITKWISLFLALCLLIGALPAALAEEIALEIVDEVEADAPQIDIANANDITAPEAPVKNDAGEGIALTADNFPDASFRSCLSTQCDKNGDGYLSDQEVEWYADWLSVDNKMIQSLKGIELFPNLEFLSCSSNLLTSLDLSKNTALVSLYCAGNQIKKLDLSKNTNLKNLSCYNNQLTALDLSKNAALESLSCGNNQLKSLDVSGKANLKTLQCYKNQLTTLKVSKCPQLTNLSCYNNQLTALSLAGDAMLSQVSCYDNQITKLDLSNFNVGVQALFTDANTKMYSSNMRIGNDTYYVYCDNYVELTMNGKVLRPLNVKELSFKEKEDIVLNVGDTYQLKPVLNPAKAKPVLTYEASDDGITVSKTGKITAKKAGYAYVKVTSDNTKYAYVYVRVIAPDYIELDTYDISLGKGETFTPKATVFPEGVKTTLKWKSSNPKAASVNKKTGKITAKKKGDAYITVTADNDVSTGINVYVYAAPKSVTLYKGGKKLKKNQTVTLKKGKSLKLSAQVNDGAASNKLTWSSSKKAVATVSKTGKVTAKKKGTAVITVKTYNNKTYKIKIKVN